MRYIFLIALSCTSLLLWCLNRTKSDYSDLVLKVSKRSASSLSKVLLEIMQNVMTFSIEKLDIMNRKKTVCCRNMRSINHPFGSFSTKPLPSNHRYCHLRDIASALLVSYLFVFYVKRAAHYSLICANMGSTILITTSVTSEIRVLITISFTYTHDE